MNNMVLRSYWREIVALIVLAFTFTPALMWMYDRWFAEDSYYSHGILIPFVSIYFIWQMRDELKALPRRSSPLSYLLIVFALAMVMMGAIFRIYFLTGFAFVVMIWGLSLLLYGTAIVKKIAFPLVFLLFMVPLPMVVITNMSFNLKLFAAKIAAIILNEIGLEAVQQGSLIQMRMTQVVVDDVCSGLRSLITLTALGSLFTYQMKAVWWKRTILFLSTIPIAVITNVCRVILLSLISELWGPEYATGTIHDVTGFMIFVLAFILLFATSRLIES